jgi:predicted nucleic acid-binding protein
MNVVDSSAWLEYFAAGPNAGFFAGPIEDVEKLIVPSVCILEVFKRVFLQRSEAEALAVAAQMLEGQVVALDSSLAIDAAKISADTKLPLADSIVLATARLQNAVLWTQDSHFEGMAGVKYVGKK